jgi:hypothetical protein
MPGPTNQFYRLRIKDATGATGADAIVITSVRGGVNPYIVAPPRGDGASYDPLTGESMLGAYTVQVADWPIGGSPVQRVVTSQLEDTNSKQQLAYRHTILEMGTDGVTYPVVLIAGVLSLLRLVDAMTYELTIQDPMRAMEQSTVFAPTSSMLMTDWFTAWPYRGCLAGGPIMTPPKSGGVGPFNMRDLGGWEMRVDGGLGADQFGSAFYILRPRVVYGPPDWVANQKSNLNDFAEEINRAAAQYQQQRLDGNNGPWKTIEHAMLNAYAWRGITWLIDKGDGVGFQPWKPYPFDQVIVAVDGAPVFLQTLVSNAKTSGWGIAVMPDVVGGANQTLTDGQIVKVRALTVLPTEESPLWISGNPCDLLAQLWGSVPNLRFDQAALDTLRQTITYLGDTVMTFRITGAMKLGDLVNEIVRPLGIGIRGDNQGRLQVFDGRLGNGNTAPSVQINAADVIECTTSLPFELDPSRAARTIVFTQTRFTDQRLASQNKNDRIVSGVVEGTDELTLSNIDPGALQFGALDWRTEAMISQRAGSVIDAATKTLGSKPVLWQQYVWVHAQRIFDRFGRGGIGFETTLIRGGAGDALNLGDEALINLPQIPNHNYRIGDNPTIAARRMQITRRTALPEGYQVRFDDSGPNLQPVPLVPVLTIAASTDAPRTVGIVTITNAAAINAGPYGARLQWAVTTGGAPGAEQWSDVTAWPSGTVPTTVRLSPALSGTTVYVRARCEAAPRLPSNWGTPVSLVLSTINPPTGLAISFPDASDGSLALLQWTPGASTSADLTDIWLRVSGQPFGLASRIQVLNPVSTQYRVEGLTPGQAYVVSVQHRDPRTGDVSAPTDLAFTAGSTARVLAAPVYATGFSGAPDPNGIPNRDGTYGIAVLAAEFPGFLEVDVATETGVGSNAYGGFVTKARAPAIASVSGNWTTATFVAPNDGLHRKLRARHVLDGCTPSAYTAEVIVLPWTPQALPPLAAQPLMLELTAQPPTTPGVNMRVSATGVDPSGQTMQVALVAKSSNVGIVSGPALGVYAPNGTIWELSQPLPGQGPGSATFRVLTPDGRTATQSMFLPEQTVLANPQGTVAIDANGAWTATADGPAGTQSFKWLTSTSAFPSDASVIAGGAQFSPGRTFSTTSAFNGGPLLFGQTIFLTIVAFTGLSGAGIALPAIHIRGSYLSVQASKFDTYTGSSFVIGGAYVSSINIDPFTGVFGANPGANPTRPQGTLGLKISNGVRITSLSMYCLFNFTVIAGKSERLLVSVDRFLKNNQTLFPVALVETDSPSSAAQLVTQSGLNVTVDTNANMYQAYVMLQDQGNTATAFQLWNFTIGYTADNVVNST